MQNNFDFLDYTQSFTEELNKSKVMNDLIQKGLVPVIENEKLVIYSVKLNDEFYELREIILKELSEIYTVQGIYDASCNSYFNSSSRQMISCKTMSIEEIEQYVLQIENEHLRNFLRTKNLKEITIKKYPKLYQIMNGMDEGIDLDFIVKYLCQFLDIDYNYYDKLIVSIKLTGINSFGTRIEQNLSYDKKIDFLKQIYKCIEIEKLDNNIIACDDSQVLELARRNTEIISTEGFHTLINIVVPNRNEFKGKIKINR